MVLESRNMSWSDPLVAEDFIFSFRLHRAKAQFVYLSEFMLNSVTLK